MLTVHVSHVRIDDGDIVVAAIGNLIDRTADNLRLSLHSVIEQRPVRILVDLGGLDAMSSVGERLLIEAVWPGRMGLHWRFTRAPKRLAGDSQRSDFPARPSASAAAERAAQVETTIGRWY
jgi:hypothetical protein